MIMMVCANQREYMVYDEEDGDESVLLRRVSGGHQEEITVMTYDFHLSLVATGCINGEITLYDFEMSKVVGLLLAHSSAVTSIQFMSPYPLLASSSLDRTICIWGVRPIPIKYLNVCLRRYRNISWNFQQDVECAATRLLVWHEQSSAGI